MKIEVYGEYVDCGEWVIKVDAIALLSRSSSTTLNIVWRHKSADTANTFPDKESADKVWNVITGVMRKYSK